MTAAAPSPIPVPTAASGPRPPLPGRQKAAAAVSGILGFVLCSIGWAGLASAIAVVALGSALAGLIGTASGSGVDTSHLTDQLNPGALLVPLLIVGVGGLLVWVIGILVSRGILKLSGHPKPGAVTFTGLLIAIVLSLIVSAILGAVVSAIVGTQLNGAIASLASSPDLVAASGAASGVGLGDAVGSAFAGVVPTLVIVGIVQVVLTMLIGWMSWLWMAIAFRAKAAPGVALPG